MSPSQPHDAFFRLLLEDPREVDAFLRERLPPELADQLTDKGFQREETSFVSDTLATLHADAVFSARCRDGRWVYAVIDHKSAPDQGTPERMVEYVLGVLRRHWQKPGSRKGPVPYILPIVVYHGTRPWRVPRAVAEMGSPPREVLAYEPLDLVRTRFDAMARGSSMRAGFAILRYSRVRKPAKAILREALRILHRRRPELLPGVAAYMLETYLLSAEEIRGLIDETAPKVWERVMQTVAEQWRAEAKAIGEAKGEAKGEANMLLKLLAGRFGTVPEDIRTRIYAASIEELDAWAAAVLSASSLDEVFLNGVRH